MAIEIKTLADRRQHAEGQAVDLEDAERVEIVFVPLDDGAAGHRGVFDGDDFAERLLREHHAPRVLREVPRKAEDFLHEGPQLTGRSRGGVEARFAEAAGESIILVVILQRLGHRIDLVEREAERLADVADGRARAVRDHGGRHAGPLAAVFFVDVLDHLFAAFVLEIDVDIGGFVPLLAQKSLEQQIDAVRVDRRHAQAIADGRIGRRPAALAQDVATAGELHQIPYGEEVGLVVQFLDQPQLVLDELADFFGNALRIAPAGALPSQAREMLERRHAGRAKLFGIFVTEFVERELAAFGHFDRAGHGVGTFGKEPIHVGTRSQEAFGIREAAKAQLGDACSRAAWR